MITFYKILPLAPKYRAMVDPLFQAEEQVMLIDQMKLLPEVLKEGPVLILRDLQLLVRPWQQP